jgi:predicted RNase H-like HicB family nuclease
MPDREVIFLVEESDEGGYEARALGFSVYTEAETLDELRQSIRDAVQCHFEENEMPKIVRLHLVRDEVIAL